MQTPLKIDFHGAPPDDALQRVVNDHQAQLERISDTLISSHVTVKAPGENRGSGGLYEVHIHLTLPEGGEINVGRLPRQDARQTDAFFAIDDAFRRARRQLQDRIRRLRVR